MKRRLRELWRLITRSNACYVDVARPGPGDAVVVHVVTSRGAETHVRRPDGTWGPLRAD